MFPKKIFLILPLLASLAGAQKVNPDQIQPGTNGQVLTTVAGAAAWAAASAAGCTSPAGYFLLANGSGGCTAADADYGVHTSGQFTFGSTTPVGFNVYDGTGGTLINDVSGGISLDSTSTTGGISINDGGAGISIIENNSDPTGGGIVISAGPGGFSLSGGSTGFQDNITSGAGGLFIASGGLTSPADDFIIQAQTNKIDLHSGTISNTGYASLDTSGLNSGDAFDYTVPRFTGTIGLYTGSLTANHCVQVNATGNGFIDSGGACGTSGGGSAFNALTSGSNTTATMVVGSGATLGVSGSGTISATSVGGITVSGTPSSGQVLTATSPSAANWASLSGVTSVAQTVPSWLTVTGSPITASGTLAISATTGLTANQFLATPNGSTGALAVRAIVAADIPTLNQNTTGTASNLSGTPALPNGTTATTQSAADNTAKLATDAFVIANAISGSGTTGYLPLWSGSTAQGSSPCDYGVTTANQVTCSGSAGFAVAGSGAGKISPTPTTVASLPSAASVSAGTLIVISDSTSLTAGTCTGGGSNYMIAISTGSAWICH